jgi:arylsulfatase
MLKTVRRKTFWFLLVLSSGVAFAQPTQNKVVHDAEFYILEAQNGERWAAEDKTLNAKLASLREKYGRPPNIIHIMWDDTAFGDVGIPAIQQVRGLRTPNLNEMAQQGILFTRMYTEVGCTPSRAACFTGRYAVRSGMYNIGMLRESHGMRGAEVTLAEVLSQAGYATAFHGKWHLGDVEESYPHKQGFDEAFFAGYNQILSLNTRIAEGANASIGLFEDMRPKDPYMEEKVSGLAGGSRSALDRRRECNTRDKGAREAAIGSRQATIRPT